MAHATMTAISLSFIWYLLECREVLYKCIFSPLPWCLSTFWSRVRHVFCTMQGASPVTWAHDLGIPEIKLLVPEQSRALLSATHMWPSQCTPFNAFKMINSYVCLWGHAASEGLYIQCMHMPQTEENNVLVIVADPRGGSGVQTPPPIGAHLVIVIIIFLFYYTCGKHLLVMSATKCVVCFDPLWRKLPINFFFC